MIRSEEFFFIIRLPKKHVIILLIILNALFSFGMSFAFWASSVSGQIDATESSVSLGSWYDGTPVYTAEELIDVLTTNNNTGTYILARNIDFQNLAYPSWIDNDEIVFKGIFDGNGKTLSNIQATNLRGIFGVLEGATVKNLILDGIQFNYSPTGSTTSGILSGRIQGTNNFIDNIRIKNATATNSGFPVGAVAGLIQPAAGDTTTVTATLQNIKVSSTTLSGGFSDNVYGSGGIVGTINTANVVLNDLYVEADLSANTVTNLGGIIGATLSTATVSINRAIVYANLTNTTTSTDTLIGTSGLIGRNEGASSSSDTFFSGFMRSPVLNASKNNYTVQSGILVSIGNDVSFSNSRSAQITMYRRTNNPSILINSSTTYNKLLGQKATYSTAVYQTNRSSLNLAWWATNYPNITTQNQLWEYNPTTYLYQLID